MTASPWRRVDDDGRWYDLLPRYNPLRYRVPPGHVAWFRDRWNGESVRSMMSPGRYPPGEGPLDIYIFDPSKTVRREGKEWLFAYQYQDDFAIELEVRDDGLGDIREVPPADAFAYDLANHRGALQKAIDGADPEATRAIEKGPDPRYRDVLRPDGVREYWRIHNAPNFFIAPERRVTAIRRALAVSGSAPHLERLDPDGAFAGFQVVDRFERDGKAWARLLHRDEDREYAIDVEVSSRPGFEIRPVPPQWTWQRVRDDDASRYPDLQFEP